MKKLQRVRTRRQLLRVATLSAASIPLLALAKKSASAQTITATTTTPTTTTTTTITATPTPTATITTTVNNGRSGSCFLKGTRISTPSGDRLVQGLRIGDEVQTLAGRKTIKWIGYNKFTKAEGRAWQDGVMPIRVARFAIDEETPYRDLYLSPLHCVFFNEALIPVMYLINETSIAQGTPSEMSVLEYYHVELDTHEVIYAEGALVESYDGEDRDNFSNFIQYERLYGAERQSKMTPFAPILRYRGRRQELNGLVRSLVSNVVDVRDPIQIAYDQLAERAEAMLV
jgi:Hint domain-containing protein